jgi:hypothetical protein
MRALRQFEARRPPIFRLMCNRVLRRGETTCLDDSRFWPFADIKIGTRRREGAQQDPRHGPYATLETKHFGLCD